MHVDGISCDLAEAFDCVSHKIVIVITIFLHSRSMNKLVQILPNRYKTNIETKS
jgi:hypothetical protein